MKHEINVPALGKIIIIAPTQTGKSLILSRIERMLREGFKAQTVSKTLDAERRSNNLDNPAQWELDAVAGTIWELEEINLPGRSSTSTGGAT